MNPDLVTRMAPTEGTPFIRLVTVADKNPLMLDFRNGKVLDGADLDEYYVSGLDDEPANWDDIDLEDAFDLRRCFRRSACLKRRNSPPRRGDPRFSPTSVLLPTESAKRWYRRPS